MAVLMDEKEHAKKRKKFTILGIIFLIIGFGTFVGGPMAAIITGKYFLFFIAFLGTFFILPGFLLLALGTHRAMSSFVAQSAGPVAVNAAHKYGRPIAREMAGGVMDGINGENEEMYCKYCGNRIDADSDFCKYCGKKVN